MVVSDCHHVGAECIYQRMTGPTHPKRVTVELNGERYTQKLPRSGVQLDEIVTLKDLPEDAIVQLHYRRFPTKDAYTTMDFSWKDSTWQAALPVQPVAGKCSITSPSMARNILPRSRC